MVAEISEKIGRYTAIADSALTQRLSRDNRIRTIQALLAVENHSLTLNPVTAVLDGKRVLGLQREIQEVRNAFADGNDRMGRLWQTLILRQWKPIFAWLPVETVIRDRQEDYYRVLAEAES